MTKTDSEKITVESPQDTSLLKLPEAPSLQSNSVRVLPTSESLLGTGAWTASGSGPDMNLKGRWYTLTLSPGRPIPAGASVSLFVWEWNVFATLPKDFVAYLVHDDTGHFLNVSRAMSGNVMLAPGYSASSTWTYWFGVIGSGVLVPPVFGLTDKIIVNY